LRRVARLASDVRILVHFHARVAEVRQPTPIRLPTARADRAVAYSQAVARCGWPGPVEVITPPCNVPRDGWQRRVQSPAHDAEKLVIGTAARLTPLKAIDTLIYAVGRLRGEFPQVHLEVAGAGSEESFLAEEAR